MYCGTTHRLEIDHIIPTKSGGDTVFNNLVVACNHCNSTKNAKDVIEWCKEKDMKVPEIVLTSLKKQNCI